MLAFAVERRFFNVELESAPATVYVRMPECKSSMKEKHARRFTGGRRDRDILRHRQSFAGPLG
jgi:hypothetical protein